MRVTRGSGVAGLAGMAEASWTALGMPNHATRVQRPFGSPAAIHMNQQHLWICFLIVQLLVVQPHASESARAILGFAALPWPVQCSSLNVVDCCLGEMWQEPCCGRTQFAVHTFPSIDVT